MHVYIELKFFDAMERYFDWLYNEAECTVWWRRKVAKLVIYLSTPLDLMFVRLLYMCCADMRTGRIHTSTHLTVRSHTQYILQHQ